ARFFKRVIVIFRAADSELRERAKAVKAGRHDNRRFHMNGHGISSGVNPASLYTKPSSGPSQKEFAHWRSRCTATPVQLRSAARVPDDRHRNRHRNGQNCAVCPSGRRTGSTGATRLLRIRDGGMLRAPSLRRAVGSYVAPPAIDLVPALQHEQLHASKTHGG